MFVGFMARIPMDSSSKFNAVSFFIIFFFVLLKYVYILLLCIKNVWSSRKVSFKSIRKSIVVQPVEKSKSLEAWQSFFYAV